MSMFNALGLWAVSRYPTGAPTSVPKQKRKRGRPRNPKLPCSILTDPPAKKVGAPVKITAEDEKWFSRRSTGGKRSSRSAA